MTNNDSNDPKHKYKDLPLVPDPILRKRHDLDEMRRKRAALKEIEKTQRARTGKNTLYVLKPEQFVTRARSRCHNEIRYNRVLKKGMQKRASNKKVIKTKQIKLANEEEDDEEDEEEEEEEEDSNDDEEEMKKDDTTTKTIKYQSNSVGANMVFVIRIRNNITASRSVRNGLMKLRLRTVNDGVFVRYNEINRKLLHLIEPFVIYGKPSKGVVRDLIERRGFGTTIEEEEGSKKTRVPLSDNVIIEKILGEKYNIICIEDIVAELVGDGSGDDAFVPVSEFLWPFKLSFASTRFQRKTLKVKEDVQKFCGDRGDEINDYITKML